MKIKGLSTIALTFLMSIFLGSNAMSDLLKEPKLEVAYVAAGCFWCIQKDMDKVKGVVMTEVGYIGGPKDSAKYDLVSKGGTGHYEGLKITFDANVISYAEILDVVWVNLDPFDSTGQFCDKGPQYRAAIFPTSNAQTKVAFASKDKAQAWLVANGHKDQAIVTEIVDATPFYSGEDYHQDYYKKNPLRYNFYRATCGRDRVLSEIWGDLKALPPEKP